MAIELYPFSFSEYLRFRGKEQLIGDISGTVKRGEIQAAFSKYLTEGGFPMYLKSNDDLILKTLYDNILYKDVMVRHQLVNEREVKELVYFAVSNVGKPVTYTSLAKVVGVKNSTTVKNYLEYIGNTYLLFTLSKMDNSVKTQLRNPKKAYAIDNAMIRRLGFHFSGEEGRLLENLVYVELRRRGGELFYYNSGKAECDFIVRDGFRVNQAIQVCFFMDSPETREREIRGVLEAMKTYKLSEGLIITNTSEEEVAADNKRIHILPAWKWLLGGNINKK
jgi:predicted AAA+ superfamily ATPase